MCEEQEFCSDELPEAERFEFFRAAMKKAAGIEIACTDPEPFFLRAKVLPMEPACVSVAAHTRLVADRPRRLLADGDGDFIFCLNLAGRKEVVQNGKRAVLDNADAVLLAYGAEFQAACLPDPAAALHRHFGVRLPRTELLRRAPFAEKLLATPLRNQEPLRLLAQYLECLANSAPSPSHALGRATAGHVMDLIALLLNPLQDPGYATANPGLRAARAASIRRYLEERYMEPRLTVAAAARDLGLSERYLHELMEESGERFTGMINRLRLEQAMRMLANPAHRHLRIGEIAFAVGFSDLSHFHRLFRRRFGDSPRAFRGVR